jgi:hypothetical protein
MKKQFVILHAVPGFFLKVINLARQAKQQNSAVHAPTDPKESAGQEVPQLY